MNGNLFVISGPSGAGKGTICEAFMQKHPEVYLSVSATTRPPRPGEVEGKSYFFLTQDEFREKIKRGEFLEYACFCGNYYGSPKENVLRRLKSGQDVILEIESDGAMIVRSHFPEGVFIFVCPPTFDELKRRLVGRGTESDEVVKNRLKKAEMEFHRAEKYNYMLLNDDVQKAVERLEAIIRAEKCYMPKNMDFIEKEFLK